MCVPAFWDWDCIAVFQSDAEFWDKMQAEWEELARRNWLEEPEDQGLVPSIVSPADTVSSEPVWPSEHTSSFKTSPVSADHCSWALPRMPWGFHVTSSALMVVDVSIQSCGWSSAQFPWTTSTEPEPEATFKFPQQLKSCTFSKLLYSCFKLVKSSWFHKFKNDFPAHHV